jgi:tetratricopeptide (TPR) repeat protein
VGEVLGLARIPALRAFGQIERRHRLVRSTSRNYTFDHHQVQEALYGSLNEQLREEYHRALAETLESRTNASECDPADLDGALCVDLCDHFLKGAQGARALPYLEPARAHLLEGYLHAETASLLDRALAVPGLLEGAERVRTLLRLVDTLDFLGRSERQGECAREAERVADAIGDVVSQSRAATSLSWHLLRGSRPAESEEPGRRALELALACGDLRCEGRARSVLGLSLRSLGRADEALSHLERALACGREEGERQSEAAALSNLATALVAMRRFDEAAELQRQAIEISREIGFGRGQVNAVGGLGNVYVRQGRYREAQEQYERSLELARQVGDRVGETIGSGNLAITLQRQELLVQALEVAERLGVVSREIGYREGEGRSIGTTAAVYLGLGRLEDARTLFEEYGEHGRMIGVPETAEIAEHNLAQIERELGEVEQARERVRRTLARSERASDGYFGLFAMGVLGELHAEQREFDDARMWLERARDGATKLKHDALAAAATARLALLPGGDVRDAVKACDEYGSDSTGDRKYLQEAKRMLDEAVARVPAEYHESMLTRLRVHRAIMEEWRAEFGDDADAGGSESVTRAGQ